MKKVIAWNHHSRHRLLINIEQFTIVKKGKKIPYGSLSSPQLLNIEHEYILYHKEEKIYIVAYKHVSKNEDYYYIPEPNKENPYFINLQRLPICLKSEKDDDLSSGDFSNQFQPFIIEDKEVKVPLYFKNDDYIEKMQMLYKKIKSNKIVGSKTKETAEENDASTSDDSSDGELNKTKGIKKQHKMSRKPMNQWFLSYIQNNKLISGDKIYLTEEEFIKLKDKIIDFTLQA